MARSRKYGSLDEMRRSIAATNANNVRHIYGSVKEAAEALHVDPSNLRKVLKGERQSAGGWSFSWTEELPTTKAGREMRKQVKESNLHRELVEQVQIELKAINKKVREARKEKVFDQDPVLQVLLSHTEYFGATVTGLYDFSNKNLNRFTSEELGNLLRVLAHEKRKYIAIAEKKRKNLTPEQIAAIFGTSEKVAKEYDDLVPAIFDLMHLVTEDKNFRYQHFKETVFEWLQEGKDRERFEEYLAQLYDAYAGNLVDDFEAILDAMDHVDPSYKDSYD